MSFRIIYSADEAIDILGGPRRVSEMFDPPVAERAVWNWRQRGFPAHRYREISHLLRRKQLRFVPEIFAGMGEKRPMSKAGEEYYARGLSWIAFHRGGHNGRWPPSDPQKCVGWGCVRMLAAVHNIGAWEVATDLVDYVERSEHGDPQP